MADFKVIDPALLERFSPEASPFWAGLDATCLKYQVNTPARICAFLAQWAEETRGFTRLHESFDYTPAALVRVFENRITTAEASALGRQPGEAFVPADRQAQIANIVYANRNGNGDVSSGDGYTFRGRGWCQLTFRDNYAAYAIASGDSHVISNPGIVALELHAVGCAGWYWDSRHLNDLADRGDFAGITRAINGGLNGLDERESWWEKARAIWGAT